jgi:hypothetical protein
MQPFFSQPLKEASLKAKGRITLNLASLLQKMLTLTHIYSVRHVLFYFKDTRLTHALEVMGFI